MNIPGKPVGQAVLEAVKYAQPESYWPENGQDDQVKGPYDIDAEAGSRVEDMEYLTYKSFDKTLNIKEAECTA
ncbi:hypothetical protein D3C72_2168680 [compost metagenome]